MIDRPSRSKHPVATLVGRPYAALSKSERIAATKHGLFPSVRSERERQLRARYGLTLEDYEALAVAQDHRCAACRRKWHAWFYVDHDHTALRVRGLLCARCNTIAGALEDDRMDLVREYLRRVG